MGAAEDQASPNPGHSIAGECPTLADCTLGGCCQREREASWGVFLAPVGPHVRAIGGNICKALILRGAGIVRRRRAITLLHEGWDLLPCVVLLMLVSPVLLWQSGLPFMVPKLRSAPSVGKRVRRGLGSSRLQSRPMMTTHSHKVSEIRDYLRL